MKGKTLLFLIALLLITYHPLPSSGGAKCGGRFFNPIGDVDWMGIFPIKIGGIRVTPWGEDTDTVDSFPLCFCYDPFPRVGIKVSFWEPVRLIEVVRGPGCFPSLGGLTIPLPSFAKRGGHVTDSDKHVADSFLHVHYFFYPVFSVLDLFTDFLCLSHEGFDLAYMTEFDPMWNDDEFAMLINPEAALFANPVAQAVCSADAVKSADGFPIDKLFWCVGSWGSMYPLTGTVPTSGDLPATYGLTAVRLIAKLHREGIAWKTVGEGALCQPKPALIIPKSQYKLQIAYPKTTKVFPLGRATIRWSVNKWYPGKGEDWTWVLWRKRDCCIL
mgnify:CR=1 FL=1